MITSIDSASLAKIQEVPRVFFEGVSVDNNLFDLAQRELFTRPAFDKPLMLRSAEKYATRENAIEYAARGRAEAQVWRMWNGIDILNYSECVYGTVGDEYIDGWIDRFLMLLEDDVNGVDNFRPWFAAGIYDVEYIQGCQAQGVDIELALTAVSKA